MIMYTIDSKTVELDDFRSRIGGLGYFDLPQEKRTWVHIRGERQIIMVKKLKDCDGIPHTFRITIDT